MVTTKVDLSESRQTEVLLVAWVMTGAAVLTVAVKLFARKQVVQVLGWDDFFIVFSLALSIIASTFVHYSVNPGFGRHTAAVVSEHGTEHLYKTAKMQMLGYPFNIGAFSFPNIAISILVCKLLDPNPLRTRLVYGMSILQVTLAIITVALAFGQCRPTKKLWEKNLPGSCWDPNVLNYFSYLLCAYTTMTDFILALVPVRAFWKLQMPLSTKIGLCVMMSMTFISAVVTIVKGTYLPLFTDTIDPLFNPVPLVLWGLVEQNIVIMAACVPTLRPLFSHPWRRGTSVRPSQSTSGNGLPSLFSRESRTNHRRIGPLTNIYMENVEQKNYAGSNDSQLGIVRTVEVSMEWKGNQENAPESSKNDVAPK